VNLCLTIVLEMNINACTNQDLFFDVARSYTTEVIHYFSTTKLANFHLSSPAPVGSRNSREDSRSLYTSAFTTRGGRSRSTVFGWDLKRDPEYYCQLRWFVQMHFAVQCLSVVNWGPIDLYVQKIQGGLIQCPCPALDAFSFFCNPFVVGSLALKPNHGPQIIYSGEGVSGWNIRQLHGA
jgi:hypothetical protein